jgi:hypothetical protein
MIQVVLKLLERLGIFRANRGIVASGIRPLESADHCARNLEWSTTVVVFANEVPLHLGLSVTA